MDLLTFTLASLALLATPGPTNTLLFTSGAVAGPRRSLALLGAELAGYMVSINLLIAVVGPLMARHGGLKLALQVACAAYLVVAARSLWVHGAGKADEAVGFGRVFVTTLLNPKGFIFAFAIIPGGPEAGLLARLPWLMALAAIIACAGGSWIYAGAVIRQARAGDAGGALFCRIGAVALMAFAALLSWSAVASALDLYGG
jgi:threonine/homoserine/homoserine lactone efflux protein